MRMIKSSWAKNCAAIAVRKFPKWSWPVGDGANLPFPLTITGVRNLGQVGSYDVRTSVPKTAELEPGRDPFSVIQDAACIEDTPSFHQLTYVHWIDVGEAIPFS